MLLFDAAEATAILQHAVSEPERFEWNTTVQVGRSGNVIENICFLLDDNTLSGDGTTTAVHSHSAFTPNLELIYAVSGDRGFAGEFAAYANTNNLTVHTPSQQYILRLLPTVDIESSTIDLKQSMTGYKR